MYFYKLCLKKHKQQTGVGRGKGKRGKRGGGQRHLVKRNFTLCVTGVKMSTSSIYKYISIYLSYTSILNIEYYWTSVSAAWTYMKWIGDCGLWKLDLRIYQTSNFQKFWHKGVGWGEGTRLPTPHQKCLCTPILNILYN